MLHWGRKLLFIPMLICILLISSPAITTAAVANPEISLGDKGTSVSKLQESLYVLGYLDCKASGSFDKATEQALRQFQRDQGLQVDGIAGNRTWQCIDLILNNAPLHVVKAGDTLWNISRTYNVSIDRLVVTNKLRSPENISIGLQLRIPVCNPVSVSTATNRVTPPTSFTQPSPSELPPGNRIEVATSQHAELVAWADVNYLFAKGMQARVIDCQTGLSFNVRRLYGSKHADVEPLTTTDTNTLKQIYSGSWSWSRRPVIVEVAGRRIAASINGMPHGNCSIKNNGFPGHFCVHFLNSATHTSGKPDPQHQQAVIAASNYNTNLLVARN